MIRPGDYIIVTEAEPVYITGSVISPQGIFLRDQLTLEPGSGNGGWRAGKKRRSATCTSIGRNPAHRIHEKVVVDYAAIKKNQKPDFFLQAFDIVEVPEAECFRAQQTRANTAGSGDGQPGQHV